MVLVYKNEKILFVISAILSALFWIGLTVGTLGIALIYILLAYVFFLFAHSAFIAQLKGNGVRISEEQYPDLHQKLVLGCEKVGLKEIPEAYLLRTDFFNALATKFLGRHFVVLFTDVVDALQDHPSAIDFYIGHELGHIHRKHLSWGAFIFPASILPVLGTALRRAEEYTCDRYGVACCHTEDDIKFALAAIAAGDTRWKSINVDSYLSQIKLTNGFWMSFHELTSDYPWLTKRMAAAMAHRKGEKIKHPRRHLFAWILSLFIPRFGVSGGGSLIVTVAIIGVLVAVALPAYQTYVAKARFVAAYTSSIKIKEQVNEFVITNQQWPSSLIDLGYEVELLKNDKNKSEISLYDNGMIGIKVGATKTGEEKYIVLEPQATETSLIWKCYGQNIEVTLLPSDCQ